MLTSLTSENYNYEAIRLQSSSSSSSSERVENKCYAQYVLEASAFDRLAWTCRRALLTQLVCSLVIVVFVADVGALRALVCSCLACSLLVAAQINSKCVKGKQASKQEIDNVNLCCITSQL